MTLNRIIRGARSAKAPVILQILPRLVTGGLERGTIETAAAVKAAGWTPVVASEGGPMVRELNRIGVEHVDLPLASKNPLTVKGNVGRLAGLIESRGVSLAHARSRAPAWSALKAARRRGVPFVTTFHGAYGLGPLGLKRGYNKVMALGDRVIAISEFIRRHIVDTYLGTDETVRVIHRGVDFSRFDPEKVGAARMIQLSQRWRLRDGEMVIVLPGRLTRWKGHLLLLDALSRIKDSPFRCVFVGSDQGRGAYVGEIQAALARSGLRERVLLAGECPDMPAVYMVSDVVVSASTAPEAFGRVVAEGQAMGRPVVAPSHGAAPEIVRDGETGFLFAPNDAGSLARALRAALEVGYEGRARLAKRAITHARARFSSETMCAKTMAVYQELLSAL